VSANSSFSSDMEDACDKEESRGLGLMFKVPRATSAFSRFGGPVVTSGVLEVRPLILLGVF
jgi:hypothetical protein